MYFSTLHIPPPWLVFFLFSLLPATYCQSSKNDSNVLTSETNLGFFGTYPLWLVIAVSILVGFMILGFAIVSWRNRRGNPEVVPQSTVKEPYKFSSSIPLSTIQSTHPVSPTYYGSRSKDPLGSGFVPPTSFIASSMELPPPSPTLPAPTQSLLLRSRSSPTPHHASHTPAYIQPSSSYTSTKDQRILAWSKTVPTALPFQLEDAHEQAQNFANEQAHPGSSPYADDEEDMPLALSRSGSTKKSLRSQGQGSSHHDDDDDDENYPIGVSPATLALH